MSQLIVLVGGLPNEPDHNDILNQLLARSDEAVKWEWLPASAESGYRPQDKYLRKLLTQLQQNLKHGNPGTSGISVVKLPLLNGNTAKLLHDNCDPKQVPNHIYSLEEILDWLFSPEANLIPKREWHGNLREAALVAIISKLIKNKSWNKDTQGHAWTKEEDLLNQSPVFRKDHQFIAVEATRMLSRLKGNLLLTKGGTAGTPKGWCIQLKNVSVAKKIILDQNFSALEGISDLEPLRNHIGGDDERTYRIDGEIVSERVRGICQSTS